MGQPRRATSARASRDDDAMRCLADPGSSRVVRNAVAGGAVSGRRARWPLPAIGTRSGKLTVTGYVLGVRGGVQSLVVRCDCGRPEHVVDRCNFREFRSTRCDTCAKVAAAGKRWWKYAAAMSDDAHRTRLLNRLAAAITRCHNPDCRIYKHYGSRGIFVHQEWRDDRSSFLRYVQTLPGWDDPARDMDRVDNNRGYEPGNIRFATRSENARNKRTVVALEQRVAELEARLRSR